MEVINSSAVKKEEIDRPLAYFPVNIWEDPLTSFSVSDPESERNKEKLKSLKETVKDSLMASKEKQIENIKFIDALCRLGVSYHFEHEILEQLETLFGSHDFMQMIRDNESDLYTVSLVFQVFRQFGYKLFVDVFDKFKNKDGDFKENLAEDARGLLCLCEAVHIGAPMVKIFSMKLSLSLCLIWKNSLLDLVHISQSASRMPSSMHTIGVDFNILQMMYRKEIGQVFRSAVCKNRTVESHFWAVGSQFEPCYSQARIMLTKLIIVLTIVDDTYDAYGTMEELVPFTNALLSWNPSGIDGLPESMKYLHHVVLDFFDKVEDELEKEERPGSAKSYIQEAKWLNEDYVATFEEYKENGVYSANFLALSTISFLGKVDEGTLEVLEWLSTFPPLLVTSSLIGRLCDDIASCKFEHKRKHVGTSIDCYMKQYGVSWEKAKEDLKVMALDSWKSLNQELMTKPHQFPFPIVTRFLNFSRAVEVLYKDNDIFTHPELMKDYVVSLFLDNIPI
ncbi:unnamed protein product [Arabis nemorensis]|uniref:Terpene synthase N-terminal domain-containing protein n=1 Tax=Arabis nemorensis TaxID=586526 RepID=A0A565BUK0_9BRAS|nr:unnamed protein product [Arabis nemorensis]